MEEFSLGEVAAPVIAFGDIQVGRVNRSLVEYFFGMFLLSSSSAAAAAAVVVGQDRADCVENERLPAELGWTRPEKVISLSDISTVTRMIRNATSLITPSKSSSDSTKRDLHGGLFQ